MKEIGHINAAKELEFKKTHDIDMDGAKCNGCDLCCLLLAVEFPAYKKRGYVQCKYQGLSGDGCKNYENRPIACKKYACGWLRGKTSDKYKPHHISAVINEVIATRTGFDVGMQMIEIIIDDFSIFKSKISASDLRTDFPAHAIMLQTKESLYVGGKILLQGAAAFGMLTDNNMHGYWTEVTSGSFTIREWLPVITGSMSNFQKALYELYEYANLGGREGIRLVK